MYDLNFAVHKLKLRSFKNRELDLSDLPQNSNFGREFVQKSGVQIPARSGRSKNFVLFFFSFLNSSHKSGYLLFKSLFDILCN